MGGKRFITQEAKRSNLTCVYVQINYMVNLLLCIERERERVVHCVRHSFTGWTFSRKKNIFHVCIENCVGFGSLCVYVFVCLSSTFCHQSVESTINQSSNAIIVIEIRTLYSWREITKPIISHFHTGWMDWCCCYCSDGCSVFRSIERIWTLLACMPTTRISIIWPDIWKVSGWFYTLDFICR